MPYRCHQRKVAATFISSCAYSVDIWHSTKVNACIFRWATLSKTKLVPLFWQMVPSKRKKVNMRHMEACLPLRLYIFSDGVWCAKKQTWTQKLSCKQWQRHLPNVPCFPMRFEPQRENTEYCRTWLCEMEAGEKSKPPLLDCVNIRRFIYIISARTRIKFLPLFYWILLALLYRGVVKEHG